MTSELESASVKYLATPHVVIPVEEGRVHVYRAHGATRTFVTEISEAALADWLIIDYTTVKKQYDLHKSNEAHRHEMLATQRTERKLRSVKGAKKLDPFDLIKDLDLEIDLEI